MAQADWDKPFGVNTSRVGASMTEVNGEAKGFASSWDAKGLPFTTQDCGKRSESDGNPSIWSAYDEGY